MPRNMKDLPVGSNLSAVSAFAITPHDSNLLTYPIRALTVGVDGIVVYKNWDNETCTTGSLPAGTYSLQANSILATGTTATNLTGWV